MTARRYATIWCDGVADGGFDCGDQVFGDNATRARHEARAGGWLVGLPGGRDLCPEHVGQRDETTRWGEGGHLRFPPGETT